MGDLADCAAPGFAPTPEGRLARAGDPTTRLDALRDDLAVDDEVLPQVLRKIGMQRRPPTFPLVAPHLNSRRPEVRRQAILAAVRADPAAARPVVLPLIIDPDASVAEAAAKAARCFTTADDIPALTAALTRTDALARGELPWALAATGDDAALPHLERLLTDASVLTRLNTRNAVAWSGLAGAEQALDKALRRSPIGHRSDLRRARRSRALVREPSPLVIPTAQTVGGIVAAALFAAALTFASVPLILDVATIFGTLIGLVSGALVMSVVAVRADGLSAGEVACDRARAEHVRLPSEARHCTPGSLALRRATWWATHAFEVAMLAAVIGLESAIPAGGVISGAAAAMAAGAGVALIRRRRRIAAAPVQTYVQIDARGRIGRRVWIAPGGS